MGWIDRTDLALSIDIIVKGKVLLLVLINL